MKNRYLRLHNIQYLVIVAIAMLNTSCCVTGYCQVDNPKSENPIEKYNSNQE